MTQTTHDTVALAAHAAEVGADAVAVIGPPYFKLDAAAQHAHLLAAADHPDRVGDAVVRLYLVGRSAAHRLGEVPCGSRVGSWRQTHRAA